MSSKLLDTHSAGFSFRLTNFTTDPFAVSTWSIALISWIIAFVGSLTADIATSFPKFTWWGLVYQLFILVMMFFFYAFDIVDQYKVFLTGALTLAAVYTTNSTTSLVWTSGAPQAAASAGAILLSMVNLIWIFYYGGDNSSPVNQWVDSFSLRGPRSSTNPFHAPSYTAGRLSSNDPQYDEYRRSTWSNQKYVSSTRLNGLENFSERENNTNTPIYDIPENEDGGTHISTGTAASGYANGTNLVIDDFPYTARALYSYESSPDDENEISLEKGEILKVNDIHSRWWQAKRANGEIGICPSNYVELIE